MKRRLRAWIAPVVMAGLTIWASGVTLGELRADDDEGFSCYQFPLLCEHFDGQCGGFCVKPMMPDLVTCCWSLGEE